MSKLPIIPGRAPGYWGRNINLRIRNEQVASKVISWNYDKIMAMGLPYAVWREASSVQGGLTTCSCVKDTAKQADIPCNICYGTGATPGYFKFGTQNYWRASTDAGWTMTNCALDKDNRPFRIRLTDGQISGTAVSTDIPVSLTGKTGDWEYKVDAFTRDGGVASSITVEFSDDSGVTWYSMSQLNTRNPSATIRFRVTIARNTSSIKSPMFEIVRIRFPIMGDLRNELSEPVVRFIPTWDKIQENRTNYGTKLDNAGKRFWTLPLTYFNTAISKETPLARLADDVIVESRYGSTIGIRFALIEFNYSDTFGEFTRQEFAMRQYVGEPGKLSGEFAYRVF